MGGLYLPEPRNSNAGSSVAGSSVVGGEAKSRPLATASSRASFRNCFSVGPHTYIREVPESVHLGKGATTACAVKWLWKQRQRALDGVSKQKHCIEEKFEGATAGTTDSRRSTIVVSELDERVQRTHSICGIKIYILESSALRTSVDRPPIPHGVAVVLYHYSRAVKKFNVGKACKVAFHAATWADLTSSLSCASD